MRGFFVYDILIVPCADIQGSNSQGCYPIYLKGFYQLIYNNIMENKPDPKALELQTKINELLAEYKYTIKLDVVPTATLVPIQTEEVKPEEETTK